MRVVIDTNRLRSSELSAYLLVSPHNRAVINEWVAIETYKQERPSGVLASYRLVASCPGQIIVLHGTGRNASLVPGALSMADRMIDLSETAAFDGFSSAMARAHAGDRAVLAEISVRRRWAVEQLTAMAVGLPDTSKVAAIARSMFSDEEWRRIERGEPFSASMRERFTQTVIDVTVTLALIHPAGLSLLDPPLLYDQFVFRLAVVVTLHLFIQAKNGAAKRNAKQALNDRVDWFHITHATYFNGLMTNDVRCARTHQAVRAALSGLGVALAPDYLDAAQEQVRFFIDQLRAEKGLSPIPTKDVGKP